MQALKRFFALDIAGGVLLALAAVLAMIVANSPLHDLYHAFIHAPVVLQIAHFTINKDAHHLINDGLMAVFFFLVGLELKREALIGELSNPKNLLLPIMAAIGGMAVPALVYAAINHNTAFLSGWAIPAATDIAFALGVLSLLGNRVPNSLKVFLASIAIFDDLGAIIIIALFYTAHLSATALAIALACLVPLFLLNRSGITRLSPYLFIGLIMWAALLKSGVHATLAGVALAFFIPLRTDKKQTRAELTQKDTPSPLIKLEHDLHHTVTFGILPLFAFANAGISFAGTTMADFLHTVPLGIGAGLLIGKQLGVMIATGLVVKLGFAKLPTDTNWLQIYGVALLCGIGFTMSLFISGLAFEISHFDPRLGILAGSLLSGVLGYLALVKGCKNCTESGVLTHDLEEGYFPNH